jgi:hypothetical protein
VILRGEEVEDIDVFCYELTPLTLDLRPVSEWVLEHLQEWDAEEFRSNFSLGKEDNHEIVFKGTIIGWYDHLDEWDERVEIDESQTQGLPDDWFDDLDNIMVDMGGGE